MYIIFMADDGVLLLAPPLSAAVPPQFTAVPPFNQIQYGFVH
jgi:hypothetical protein